MPASPYSPAPVVYAKPARNRLGIAALIIAIAALVALPLAGFVVSFIGTLTGPQQTQDTVGWAVLGGLVGMGFGFAVAGPLSIIAIVLAVIGLTRKNLGKIAAIIAIVVAAPAAIFGTLLLIPYVDLLF